MTASGPVVRAEGLSLLYGKVRALDAVSIDLPAGCIVGLIGPDGVGKSSFLALVAGARKMQAGRLDVLGGDMRRAGHRARICPRIAYMPQGLGRNLYPTLSVRENVDFFGRLFGESRDERDRRIADLLDATDLAPFADRPTAKLSGGMKQKLGLCCALIHDPDLLILDEPTTGVDPLSRREFWALIARIRAARPGMSLIVASAYMEEAAGFDHLVAMDDGKVLATGSPAEILNRTGTANLDEAFISLLPEERRTRHHELTVPPRDPAGHDGYVVEAENLTVKFGDFAAVKDLSFRIGKGEIFGFLGSNGCGKTTTMKALTGLVEPAEGTTRIDGRKVDARDMATRKRIGYMTQSFSLYSELTVRQNLDLHARLFDMAPAEIGPRIAELAQRFDLEDALDSLPLRLPLGIRQRLSLAVALIHRPEVLILDEPTSGVDPVARDIFWQALVDLSRKDGVTIFISTHYMSEATRCDRISFLPPYFVTPDQIDMAEMDARMDAGIDTFSLVFPPDFQSDLVAGARPELQLNVDATRVSQAFAGAGYIQAIVDQEITGWTGRDTMVPVGLALRARFNPALDPGWFGALTAVISAVTMLSIILSGAALIREREHGTVEHLLVMPVSAAEIMTSKVLSMGGVVLVAAGLSLTFMVQGVLGVPVAGSVALFLAGAALHLFATTSLGILLATISGSMPQFAMLLLLVLLPLEILSGGMTPRESMPEVVQYVMLAAPNTHFIALAQAVLFRGAGLSVVWPQLLALAVIGSAMFAFALRRFRGFLR